MNSFLGCLTVNHPTSRHSIDNHLREESLHVRRATPGLVAGGGGGEDQKGMLNFIENERVFQDLITWL